MSCQEYPDWTEEERCALRKNLNKADIAFDGLQALVWLIGLTLVFVRKPKNYLPKTMRAIWLTLSFYELTNIS